MDLQGKMETYWCTADELPEPEPTPAPTPYAGPFWTPGSKVCYIGECTCGPTYKWEWCNTPCNRTEPDGKFKFCPNSKKATEMTQFCHSTEENCQKCNGHYCDQ